MDCHCLLESYYLINCGFQSRDGRSVDEIHRGKLLPEIQATQAEFRSALNAQYLRSNADYVAILRVNRSWGRRAFERDYMICFRSLLKILLFIYILLFLYFLFKMLLFI